MRKMVCVLLNIIGLLLSLLPSCGAAKGVPDSMIEEYVDAFVDSAWDFDEEYDWTATHNYDKSTQTDTVHITMSFEFDYGEADFGCDVKYRYDRASGLWNQYKNTDWELERCELNDKILGEYEFDKLEYKYYGDNLLDHPDNYFKLHFNITEIESHGDTQIIYVDDIDFAMRTGIATYSDLSNNDLCVINNVECDNPYNLNSYGYLKSSEGVEAWYSFEIKVPVPDEYHTEYTSAVYSEGSDEQYVRISVKINLRHGIVYREQYATGQGIFIKDYIVPND